MTAGKGKGGGKKRKADAAGADASGAAGTVAVESDPKQHQGEVEEKKRRNGGRPSGVNADAAEKARALLLNKLMGKTKDGAA